MVLLELFTMFSSKNVLIKHKEDCLSINGVESIKVEEEIIEI